MRVLVVGSGGREHAIAAAIADSPLLTELHCAPGNPGIAEVARCHPVQAADVEGLCDLARAVRAELVVVGPEAPLVAGLADALRAIGIAAFGPGREAARLEGSKAFAREIMAAAGVPAARGVVAHGAAEARTAIAELGGRVVVKADGLAAGKGVIVCEDASEAEQAVRSLLAAFGDRGELVIEERLEGPEASLLAICDGETALALPPARDFKRIGDGDRGPNTGGMGAYSPLPDLPAEAAQALVAEVHVPVLRELRRRGVHFNGCLYAGLMLTPDGPRVLEFNVRLGDPEAQVLVPRLADDLLDVLAAAAAGRLEGRGLRAGPDAAVAVVLASRGYPASAEAGVLIEGVADAAALPGVRVFHAGTALRGGRLVTAGGRVLAVTGLGPTIDEARGRAYAGATAIGFDGAQRRKDIAHAVMRPASTT